MKKDIKFKLISNEQINNNMWILSIEIVKQKTINGQYTIIYHSPSSSDADFIRYFNEWVEKSHNEEKNHIICGDFNIDMSETTNKKCYKNKLNSTTYENGLIQIVTDFTRITENTKTLIDLIITNVIEMKCMVMDSDNISDHATINIYSQKNLKRNETKKKR